MRLYSQKKFTAAPKSTMETPVCALFALPVTPLP